MNGPEMIPCDQVIPRLWEYLDGELNEQTAAAIRAHLELCARCFPQYDFQRAYKEFMRRTARRPLPPDLRRRVFEAILEEEARGAGARPWRAVGERLRRWLARLLRRSG